MDYVIGGLAGVGAGFFSNPFDVVKTRMQLQGELKAKGQHDVHYRNVFHATYTITKHEGLKALQKGLTPALWFQLVVNGTRLGMYQTADNYGLIRDKKGNTTLQGGLMCGALAGAAGAFFGSPFLLVKTQLMSHSAKEIAVGTQHGHEGFTHAILKVYHENGVKGLWRGAASTMLRNSIGSASQIVSFSRVKEILREYPWFSNKKYSAVFIASNISGLVKTIIMTPMDVIVTRLYNQGTDAKGRGLLYNGIFDCARKIIQAEGFTAFYKGFGPSYLRQAPHSVLILVFWDMLKDLHHMYLNQIQTTKLKY